MYKRKQTSAINVALCLLNLSMPACLPCLFRELIILLATHDESVKHSMAASSSGEESSGSASLVRAYTHLPTCHVVL